MDEEDQDVADDVEADGEAAHVGQAAEEGLGVSAVDCSRVVHLDPHRGYSQCVSVDSEARLLDVGDLVKGLGEVGPVGESVIVSLRVCILQEQRRLLLPSWIQVHHYGLSHVLLHRATALHLVHILIHVQDLKLSRGKVSSDGTWALAAVVVGGCVLASHDLVGVVGVEV